MSELRFYPGEEGAELLNEATETQKGWNPNKLSYDKFLLPNKQGEVPGGQITTKRWTSNIWEVNLAKNTPRFELGPDGDRREKWLL